MAKGKHMAPGGRTGRSRSTDLRDGYSYEQSREDVRRSKSLAKEEPGDGFEDVSSYSSSQEKRRDSRELERQRKPRRRRRRAIVIAVIVFLVIVAAVIGFLWWYVQGYVLKDLTVNTDFTKDREELGFNEEVVMNDAQVKNIALLGVDSRFADNSGRSDVVMIITVDNRHNKIKMTSILRDSDVSIRMVDEDGNYYYFDDKITHAFAYGGETLSVQTINRNFFLNITDYVTVNFEQTAGIVDAFGGVDVELSSAEIYEINENLYNLRREVANLGGYTDIDDSDYLSDDGPGMYHLNGNQAVAYARIRHLEGGDNMRASRQQNVLISLLNSVRGKSKLEYPEMIRQIMPMCETSLTLDDILEMVPIMLTDFTIETLSVPGEEENAYGAFNDRGAWVYLYDLQQAAAHVNRFIYEEEVEVTPDSYVDRVSNIYRTRSYGSYSITSQEAQEAQEMEDGSAMVDLPQGYTVPVEGEENSAAESGAPSSEEGSAGSSRGESENSSGGDEPWYEPGGYDEPRYEDPDDDPYEEPSYEPNGEDQPGGGEEEPGGNDADGWEDYGDGDETGDVSGTENITN